MNCQTAFDRIPLRAVGRLEREESEHLDEHLAHCSVCSEERKAYALMLGPPDDGEPVPSDRMRERLRLMVAEELRAKRSAAVRWLAAAAIVAVIALGLSTLFVPRPASPDEGPGIATDRLEQIASVRSRSQGMPELMNTLERDPNPAIRLAALDSIVQGTSSAELRSTLERAQLTQSSPLVHSAITALLEEVEP